MCSAIGKGLFEGAQNVEFFDKSSSYVPSEGALQTPSRWLTENLKPDPKKNFSSRLDCGPNFLIGLNLKKVQAEITNSKKMKEKYLFPDKCGQKQKKLEDWWSKKSSSSLEEKSSRTSPPPWKLGGIFAILRGSR